MNNRLKFISIVTILLAVVSYAFFDEPLALYFHSNIPYNVEQTFELITKIGDSNWILISSFLIFLIFKKRYYLVSRQALFIFISISLSGIFVQIMKIIFSRSRPKGLFLEPYEYGFNFLSFYTNYLYTSFPSGHSATAIGLSTALSLLLPKYTVVFFIIGFIIAFSRILLTWHFLSDVLIGGLIGAIITVWLNQKYFHYNMSKGLNNND